MLFTRRTSVEKRKHLAGLARMFGYFSVLGIVCAGVSVRNARAEVGDKSIALGRQMLELANATQHDVTKVNLNGQPMFIGSSIGKDSVQGVLSRYEQHCKTNAAQSVESWKELGGKTDEQKKEDVTGFTTSGLMRSGGDQEGTVICFVRSDQSKASAKEAFKSFTETGELGALGQLRYVYAKKTSKGNTHVLTAWTTNKFNLNEILPKEGGGDVPGSDFGGDIPRINGSQRILSTMVEGTSFGVNVYRSDMAPKDVAKLYDTELTQKGWFALDAEIEAKSKDKATIGHLYEKNGVVLTLATNVQDGKTFTALGLAGVQPSDTFKKKP